MSSPLRVVIAEDNPLLRDGLAELLGDVDIKVVGTARDADELLGLVERERPDVAVVDIRMPPTQTDEGMRAALRIRAGFADTAVLVLSQWIETDYARELLAASPDHVGYLLKDRVVSTAEFVESLRRVAAGGSALDPEVVRHLMNGPRDDTGIARLTEREHEILALIAEGLSNTAIARRTNLASRSVEKNITAIFTKLDLTPTDDEHRRVLAVVRYLENR